MESFLQFARPVEKIKRIKTALGPMIAAGAAAQDLAVAPAGKRPADRKRPAAVERHFFQPDAQRQPGRGQAPAGWNSAPAKTPTITISDDGPGIAAAVKDKIWLPFFSTRDKGTGMGLATVKKLVSALNGDIQLLDRRESREPRSGSCSIRMTNHD